MIMFLGCMVKMIVGFNHDQINPAVDIIAKIDSNIAMKWISVEIDKAM